jgi:hypothetical protein
VLLVPMVRTVKTVLLAPLVPMVRTALLALLVPMVRTVKTALPDLPVLALTAKTEHEAQPVPPVQTLSALLLTS